MARLFITDGPVLLYVEQDPELLQNPAFTRTSTTCPPSSPTFMPFQLSKEP
jgi:hypothetical protein